MILMDILNDNAFAKVKEARKVKLKPSTKHFFAHGAGLLCGELYSSLSTFVQTKFWTTDSSLFYQEGGIPSKHLIPSRLNRSLTIM